MNLSNQTGSSPVACVTGSGANRLGRRLALELAEQGYLLAVHYFSSDEAAQSTVEQIRCNGGTAEAFQADVRREADVEALMDQITTRFGRLDLLVTMASRWDRNSLEQVTTEQLRTAWEVDTLGTFLCARTAGLMMVGQPLGGSIVTVGDASLQQPRTGEPAYYLAKAAIPGMTRMLAVELGERHPGVRVNAVLPGSTLAPAELTEADHQRRQDETLTRTADDPQSLINAILYLARSPSVTGTSLTIDCGRSLTHRSG